MSKKKKNDKLDNEMNENLDAQEKEVKEKQENLEEELNEQQEFVENEDEKKLEQKESQSSTDDWKDKYLRILAEFNNYKKRTSKEKEQLYDDATIDTLGKILPVLDTLQRAITTEPSNDEAKGVFEGVLALKRQLEDILKQMGVNKIEAVGKEFDPQLHNAVMHIEDESYDANIVVEEFSIGYQYKDKVIRHSMVKVAN